MALFVTHGATEPVWNVLLNIGLAISSVHELECTKVIYTIFLEAANYIYLFIYFCPLIYHETLL